MEKQQYNFKPIGLAEIAAIKALFLGVFTAEPWNDDWSNEEQLDLYLQDLMGQNNSLTYGLYQDQQLIGLSMGRIKHWYSGTEYCIDELCIRTDKQGSGIGTLFLKEIEKDIAKQGMVHIFLQTEKDVPAYDFYLKNGFYELETNVSLAKRV